MAIQAESQRRVVETVDANRGKIISSDGFVLSANQNYYQLFAYKPQLQLSPEEIAPRLAPLLLQPPKDATEAAIPENQRQVLLELELRDKLNHQTRKWIPLLRNIDQKTKEAVEQLEIVGLGFDRYQRRYYPEASMSAHLLGFVGHNDQGNRTGYFGLEGFYDLELEGKPGRIIQDKDAVGRPILIGLFDQWRTRQGRNLHLHLDRSVQHLAETFLVDALEKYEARSGEILIMNPYTGSVVASASFPNYDPSSVGEYPPQTYKNPVVANTYEPGSTFKAIVMAAGLDAGVITPETICDSTCDGPVSVGGFSIKTWNNTYKPGKSMTEVLATSDNTGMIFVANQLGNDLFVKYLHNFGFGEVTGIDLQEETSARLRSRWGNVDIATASFGQGIAVTGVQMLQAVNVIANGGQLMRPQVVKSVDDNGRILEVKPDTVRRVISKEAASMATEMMVVSAHQGEARWAVMRDYKIAGKTGTAQIPIDGHYDKDKTIASFVGFAPADDPKFSMIVTLTEPKSSPWAAETAAPLWYSLARELLLYYKVPPVE